jgi:hypothetical protein
MLTPTDQLLWLLTTVVEGFVAYLLFAQGLFRKFPFFNIYFLFCVAFNIVRYSAHSYFGTASAAYYQVYYFSAILLSVLLFFSIWEVAVHVVGSECSRVRVTLWSVGALAATAWYSFSVAALSGNRGRPFFFELSENIFFGCCLAMALLWIWRLRHESEDSIAGRFVTVLGVYFFLFLLVKGAYQLHGIYRTNWRLSAFLYPIMGASLPFGCGFALVSGNERRKKNESRGSDVPDSSQ